MRVHLGNVNTYDNSLTRLVSRAIATGTRRATGYIVNSRNDFARSCRCAVSPPRMHNHPKANGSGRNKNYRLVPRTSFTRGGGAEIRTRVVRRRSERRLELLRVIKPVVLLTTRFRRLAFRRPSFLSFPPCDSRPYC